MTAVTRLLVRSRLPSTAVLRATPRSLPALARSARPIVSRSPARLVTSKRWASSAAAVAETEDSEQPDEVVYPVREAPPLSANDKKRLTRQRNIGMYVS